MSRPSAARYRTTNWSGYAASLRKRGSLVIWLDKDMTWLIQPDRKPGRPAVFLNADPAQPDDQGSFQAAVAANDRD